MKITNKFSLPEFVVTALTFSDYSRGEAQISVTQLIDSPRIAQLKNKHYDEMESDAVDYVWSRFGTSVHNLFEESIIASGIDAITEERLFTKVDSWTLSGAIDMQEPHEDGIIISDFKVTSVWSVIFAKASWHQQLNAYAYLVRKAKQKPVKKLQIVALLRDWSRRKAEQEQDYPESPVAIIDIPLWTEADQDAYVEERVQLHMQADFDVTMGQPLVPCSSEDMWEKPTKYAVMKKGRQRAVRILESQEEADKLAEEKGTGHFVEQRLGELTRCQGDWCGVSQFCDQWNN